MLNNLDELMMKMCASDNDGVGIEVGGKYYFYEEFKNDDAISRAYRHFGANAKITFYSMTWAHQKRIKKFMELYKKMIAYNEFEKAEKLARVIAKYIAKWSGCTLQEAIRQIEKLQVSYLKIT